MAKEKRKKHKAKRSAILYLLLDIVLGFIGIHDFYIGYNKRAVIHVFLYAIHLISGYLHVKLHLDYSYFISKIMFSINFLMCVRELFFAGYLDGIFNYNPDNNYWDKVVNGIRRIINKMFKREE